jgi:glycosyltransferase involved in cell wall biosynthesis
VLCSLSEHEAYGLAPAEALAAGVRVVLSDIPAHAQFTASGRAALVAADAADAALADEIGRALAAAPVPADAPSPVPDWNAIAGRLAALYHSLRGTARSNEPVGARA